MAHGTPNSIAAVLSLVVRVIFWLAVIAGVASLLIVGTGFLGSLNGGSVKVPGVEAYVQDLPPGRLFAAMIGIIVFSVGIAYVCNQLSRILSTLADGDPFVPENAPRLTRIAAAIALIEIIRTTLTLVIASTFDLGENFTVRININLAVWGAVVVLFVLAEVFREGSRLREEEKMTI